MLAAVKRDPRLATRANGIGVRLLYHACSRGHLELARGLLAHSAQINARDSDGWDALMVASFCGHLAVVGWLLSKGADPNARDDRNTALSLAACNNHPEVCLLLISHAADLLEIVRDGQTAHLYGDNDTKSPPSSRHSAALSSARPTTRARTRTLAGSAAGRLCVCVCVCAGVLRLPAPGCSQGVPAHDHPSSTAGCCDSPSADRHSRAVPGVSARHSVRPPRLLEADRELPVSHQVCSLWSVNVK